jgi:hypothetical protein
MSNKHHLPVPSDVAEDPNAIELIRAWNSNGGLICALQPMRWEDSRSWGILLADIARHVANALREERGDEQAVTLVKIRDMFNLELSDPTDIPTGSFLD